LIEIDNRTRRPQAAKEKGSQKWIQRSVHFRPALLDDLIIRHIPSLAPIKWCSPLSNDDCAEYSDGGFLEKIGAQHLAPELEHFWPRGGPWWDALATVGSAGAHLVEAKAHIGELCTNPTGASEQSATRIGRALTEAAAYIGASPRALWSTVFYQLANRLAHLYFLRKHDVDAYLVLVNFVGDADMQGPRSKEEWHSAYEIVWHVLGIRRPNKLSERIIEIYPDVSSPQWATLPPLP
jgi:hypothetical protein